MQQENINLENIIDIIKKRWKLIISIVLAFTLVATVATFFFIKPKYEAKTKLFVGKEENTKNNSYNASDIQMYQQLLKTYTDVIETSDLVTRAIETKKLNVDAGSVLSKLSVNPIANTQILEISYTGTDKNQAKDIVGAITDEFVKTSKDLISNANVKVVETVRLPEGPSSPNKKLNISIGLLLGLIVGIGLAFFLEVTDTTFKSKEELETILGIPVIGEIPNTEKVK
ncbi:YveK family protein [Inconstantimicrobium mannanitabidum]|uniref:Uncharacterized protein n=1 Tax=Inconstantimicrobium mannanitabidum TaxID=1604901 RepID=A0ACB5RDU8_9CLOT|nr:Wzz/FepE/Etk N-terminal domain-containing protein [Clostridium sp. TW13]GKX67448.1 hypothetical protein rsdtw13_27060 [Clostridium sp. TW13]